MAYLISAVMSLVFILCFYSNHPLSELPWGIDRTFKYIGFYAVGNYLRQRDVVEDLRKLPRVWMSAIAVILLLLNFLLSYIDLNTGLFWFVTALIGVAAIWIAAILIHLNPVLQYLGRISLVILCVHGPIYRVIVKIVSIVAGMSTDAVRENFILAMLVVVMTLAACAIVHGVVIRVTLWMVWRNRDIKTRGDQYER